MSYTYAIILNQHGTILDGYQRYKACQELGKDPKLFVKFFDYRLLEQKFRIEDKHESQTPDSVSEDRITVQVGDYRK